MNTRSIIGLVVSIFMVVSMWYGFQFKVEQEMPNQTSQNSGGKYKYLTILNLVRQYQTNSFSIKKKRRKQRLFVTLSLVSSIYLF